MTAAATTPRRPTPPSRRVTRVSLLAAVAVAAWAMLTLDVPIERLLDLPGALWTLFQRMFLPFDPAYLPRAFEGMLASLAMAWIGTLIGAVLSLPLGFLGAKNVSSGFVSNVMRQLLNAIRAIPELVLAVVVFIPIAGLGPVAGALAIGIHSIGTLGKLTAEVVEGIDPGPVEAARSTGGNGWQVQRWGVLPQVLPEIVAFWLYRFEVNIRASAVLGVVGAGGVGEILNSTLTFGRYSFAGTTILVIIVVTILVDTVSGWVRRRIIEGAEARVVLAEVEAPEALVTSRP